LYSHNKPAEAAADLQRRREEWRQQIEDQLWRAEQEAAYNARFKAIQESQVQNDLTAQLRAANSEIDRLDALVAKTDKPAPEQKTTQRRKAEKADWIAIRAGLNGDGENLEADDVARLLTARGFELPNRTTLWRWANKTKVEVNNG
jgi:hypothetical protein